MPRRHKMKPGETAIDAVGALDFDEPETVAPRFRSAVAQGLGLAANTDFLRARLDDSFRSSERMLMQVTHKYSTTASDRRDHIVIPLLEDYWLSAEASFLGLEDIASWRLNHLSLSIFRGLGIERHKTKVFRAEWSCSSPTPAPRLSRLEWKGVHA